MKRLIILTAALFAIAIAAPAFAQVGQYDADFNNYLSHHPNEAAQIQSNPRIIDDPAYIKAHPGLNQYLDNHPNVRRTIRAQSNGAMMHGEAMRGPGDYDSNHVWRDQGWWQKNHPDVWAKRHPNR
ncbi:MAG: hypothetical protein WA854_08635 [Candidatus Binataceae bacterium]